MEQEIILMNTPEKKLELAMRMSNQLIYLQRMANGKMPDGKEATDGQKKWALGELMRLEPEFHKWGWLK